MNNFQFMSPTQFIFGTDAESSTGSWIATHGYKRVLVVCGQGHAVKSGLLGRITESLDAEGIEYVELNDVRPNPEVTSVRAGVELAKQKNVDFILAVGGGSVIDCAKAIAVAALYDGDAWDIYQRPNPVPRNTALPLGVVLTIPAAGSEASASSVLSNDELGLKTSHGGNHIRPKVAFMNPELTFSLPAYQTAAGIVDMCAHIFERFCSSTESTTVTDGIALSLLKSIRTASMTLMQDPHDYTARADIMWASTLAHNGVAGIGRDEDWTSHALEHEMSALRTEVTHGAGLAVIMPAWMKYVYPENPQRFAVLGRELFGLMPTGNVDRDALNAISEVKKFFVSLGMPSYMDDFGFVPDDSQKLAEGLLKTRGASFGSFKTLTIDDAEAIYRSAFKPRD